MTITIKTDAADHRTEGAPLYCEYKGQSKPQPARLCIKADGTVYASYNAEIGNAVSADIYHGRIQTVSLSPYCSGPALSNWLEDEETLALLKRIVVGMTEDWDGSNRRGRISEDACDAMDELERSAENIDTANIWDAGDWLDPVISGSEIDGADMTEKSDDEIRAIAAEIAQQAKNDGVIINGGDGALIKVIEGVRQHGRDERAMSDE